MSGVELWGDVATWVAGGGTTAAVAVSLRQVYQERSERQADERRWHEQEERAQAALVAVWLGGPVDLEAGESASDYISVSNASTLPVYNAVVTLVIIQGAGPRHGNERPGLADGRAVFSIVPPGRWYVALPYSGWRGMSAHPGVEIGFRDVNGRSWARRGSGELEPIDCDPVDFYGYSRPVSYQGLNRLE